jgi:hypothetical protein
VKLRFNGNNSPEKLAELQRQIETCCPVLAIFRNPVAVNLSIAQEP